MKLASSVAAVVSGISLAAAWKLIAWRFGSALLEAEVVLSERAVLVLSSDIPFILAAVLWYFGRRAENRPRLSKVRWLAAVTLWFLVVYVVLWRPVILGQSAAWATVLTIVAASLCLWIAFGVPRWPHVAVISACIALIVAADFVGERWLPFAGLSAAGFANALPMLDWFIRTGFSVLAVAWLFGGSAVTMAREVQEVPFWSLGLRVPLVLWLMWPVT